MLKHRISARVIMKITKYKYVFCYIIHSRRLESISYLINLVFLYEKAIQHSPFLCAIHVNGNIDWWCCGAASNLFYSFAETFARSMPLRNSH